MPNNKELELLIEKYENAIAKDKSIYLDADQFGDIADHYDSYGNFEASKKLLDRALQIHPSSDLLLIKKAKILVIDSEYEEALEILENTISGYDYDLYMVKIECLLYLKRNKEANLVALDIIENEDESNAHTTFSDLGYLFVESNCFKDAIKFFDLAIEIDPEDVEVLTDLAYAYEMIGDFESAVINTNKVLDVDSYNYDAWINLGKLYSMMEYYEKAVDAFDFAITIIDKDSTISKMKAHCLSLSNRSLEAIAIFKELLVDNPTDTSLHLLLCECYATLELFNEALECLQNFEEADGQTMEFLIKKVALFYQMDKDEQALSIIDTAIHRYGPQVDLLMLAGDIRYSSDEYTLAEALYTQAYGIENDNFDLIDKLALVSIKLEKYKEAIQYTEALELLESDNNYVKTRLALLYLETNDEEHFNAILNNFTDEELMELFKLFYQPQQPELFSRALLISSLNEARTYRTLFKNIQH